MSQRTRRQATMATTVPFPPGRPASGRRLLVGDASALRPRRPALRWRWGRYLVTATTVYCVWLGHGEWVAYHRLAAQRAALAAQVAQLRHQQDGLQSAIAYAGSDAYVRSEAMQLFGMVGQGEVSLAPLPASTASPSH